MNRLGVVGWPVAHSRSPAIQNAALQAVGLGDTWRYQLLPIPPELFNETVLALPGDGFRGVNVTIPHKAAALALATSATERAKTIGAANTLLFQADGGLRADNTDAPGFVNALSAIQQVSGCTAVVLGAGGTARAAVWALLDAGAAEVFVWNRTKARASELCVEVGGTPLDRDTLKLPVEVIVNATSIGLHEGHSPTDLPPFARPEQLASYRAVVDFVYSEHGTPLVNAARAAGVPTVDGLEILVGQGALAFELFTGLPAPLDVMRSAVGLCSAP
jgi:shikimate dehydrogenase